jgi:hypothetical protein
MRYSAYLMNIFYDSDLTVSYMGFGTIEQYKKHGFKVTSEKYSMVLMTGGAKHGYSKIVLVPETHPMFNGGLFDKGNTIKVIKGKTIKIINIKNKLNDLMSKEVKNAFFSS